MTLTKETAEKLGWDFFHEEEGGWVSNDENKVGRQPAQGPQKAATDTVQVPREPSCAARKNLPDRNGVAEQHAHSPEGLLNAIEAWEAQYRPVKPDEPAEPPVVAYPDRVAFPDAHARAVELGPEWAERADEVWDTPEPDEKPKPAKKPAKTKAKA